MPSAVFARVVATGQGGIPANPREMLHQTLIWRDERAFGVIIPEAIESIDLASSSESRIVKIPSYNLNHSKPVEAHAWQVNEQGRVVLAAPLPTPHNMKVCELIS